MSDQAAVRGKYPNAVARFVPARHETGTSTPMWDDHWAVYSTEDLGQTTLGTGPNEAAAWRAAAAKVKVEERMVWVEKIVERLVTRGFTQNGNQLVHKDDSEKTVTIDPATGSIRASEKANQLFSEAAREV